MNNPVEPLPGAQPEEASKPGQTPEQYGSAPAPALDPAQAQAFDGSAQVALSPTDAQRVGKVDHLGGAAMAGLATGTAVGAVVGGPVGALVGGTVGTVAGILGGKAADEATHPEAPGNADGLPTEAEIRSSDEGRRRDRS